MLSGSDHDILYSFFAFSFKSAFLIKTPPPREEFSLAKWIDSVPASVPTYIHASPVIQLRETPSRF